MAIVEWPDSLEHVVPFPRIHATSQDRVWNFANYWVFSDPQIQQIIQYE